MAFQVVQRAPLPILRGVRGATRTAPSVRSFRHRSIRCGASFPPGWSHYDQDSWPSPEGVQQSPISLERPSKLSPKKNIKFKTKALKGLVYPTYDCPKGVLLETDSKKDDLMAILEKDGKSFHLKGIHLHTPISEHAFHASGRTDLEAHFVFKNEEETIAFGVLGSFGFGPRAANAEPVAPSFDLVSQMGCFIKDPKTCSSLVLDLENILPDPNTEAYYYYEGSLTTPKCTPVSWLVYQQVREIPMESKLYFDALTALQAFTTQSNSRHLQPLKPETIVSLCALPAPAGSPTGDAK